MSGTPPDLSTLQQWMQQALRFPRAVARDEADRVLAASSQLSGAEGLAIYQRSYFLRIASCMREQFPALCHALGAALFDDFTADYIRAHPPASHTLYDLGRRFPDYLEETRPDRGAAPTARETWVDFMVDLARFERQLFVLFDAPGHEGHPFADPATPDASLRLQPCFALGTYRFAVPLYYHDVRLGRAPALPPREDSFVALVRADYVTHTMPLIAPHHRFLAAMAAGGTVEDGIAAVALQSGRTPEDVRQAWQAPMSMRRRWIETGFFVAA